jgi:hypothetical protein
MLSFIPKSHKILLILVLIGSFMIYIDGVWQDDGFWKDAGIGLIGGAIASDIYQRHQAYLKTKVEAEKTR